MLINYSENTDKHSGVWRKLDFEKIEVEPRGEASPLQFIM